MVVRNVGKFLAFGSVRVLKSKIFRYEYVVGYSSGRNEYSVDFNVYFMSEDNKIDKATYRYEAWIRTKKDAELIGEERISQIDAILVQLTETPETHPEEIL